MVLMNDGKLDLETEALLEISLHELPMEELTGPDVDLAIDAWKEIQAVELD